MMVRMFANGQGDLVSIPDRIIPKTQKMVPDASLLNTQHYKVWIVVERKNFKLLFSAGIVLAVGVSNLYISSNEND